MGWNTYAHAVDAGIPSPYSHLEQIVFSRQHHAGAENLRTTDADPHTVVEDLKQEHGANTWLCGGGTVAGQLLPQIDRLIIKRNPLIFGSGIPLFALTEYSPLPFELISSKDFASGVTIAEYQRTNA